MAILGQKWISTKVVKTDDTIKFLSAGDWQPSTYKNDDGSPKNQFVIDVEFNGAEYSMSLNKVSRDNLVFAFGRDTSSWVGKESRVELTKCMVGGKMKDIITLQPILEP